MTAARMVSVIAWIVGLAPRADVRKDDGHHDDAKGGDHPAGVRGCRRHPPRRRPGPRKDGARAVRVNVVGYPRTEGARALVLAARPLLGRVFLQDGSGRTIR